jgi:hypothetical protein
MSFSRKSSDKEMPLIQRSWYREDIAQFLVRHPDEILGQLARKSLFPITESQRDAWLREIQVLKEVLHDLPGRLYLEYEIPRMGGRADGIIFLGGKVIVLEFKTDSEECRRADIEQVYDYALDLKYFHEGSHQLTVVPILVATESLTASAAPVPNRRVDGLYEPLCVGKAHLRQAIEGALRDTPSSTMDVNEWEKTRYCPTPTIIEAARALYARHTVEDITRNDAGARNLSQTSERIIEIIERCRRECRKAICFVTGVPGAGKTLVGLNLATRYSDPKSELHSVFLSGNGPLVMILREALARDIVRREQLRGVKFKKGEARSSVKSFIQNVHHFRDECLKDSTRPPVDHVAIFDEAQRAWNMVQTSSFMKRKKGIPDFTDSEPAYLISCMDRRTDWATIICLVGGGQEINTGEAGIGEWIRALQEEYLEWDIFLSPTLTDTEYGAGEVLEQLKDRPNTSYLDELHLAVSVRSFRTEKVSSLVKMLLDLDTHQAKDTFTEVHGKYPIYLTRKLGVARQWLRDQASGSERYGIVVSSQAERLKPYAVDVRSPMDPVKWFLDGKDDVRSSYYLEDVATEFHVQGLELDWSCVCWDGDFRYSDRGWQSYSFRGSKWQKIRQLDRQMYLKNAYRVLLTRARQGMVICVPEGSAHDPTRTPEMYNTTFTYLQSIGLPVLE